MYVIVAIYRPCYGLINNSMPCRETRTRPSRCLTRGSKGRKGEEGERKKRSNRAWTVRAGRTKATNLAEILAAPSLSRDCGATRRSFNGGHYAAVHQLNAFSRNSIYIYIYIYSASIYIYVCVCVCTHVYAHG